MCLAALGLLGAMVPSKAQQRSMNSPTKSDYRHGMGGMGNGEYGRGEQQQSQASRPSSLSHFYDIAKAQSKFLDPAAERPPLPADSIYVVQLEKGKELRYGRPGSGVRDDAEALEIFEDVAYAPKAGPEKAVALYESALVYATGGNGVERDLAKAVQRLGESVQLGFSEAKHTLAFFLSTGFGNKTPEDAAGVTFEAPAAEGGSIGANLAMGFRHLFGAGVPVNCSAALAAYKEMAEITMREHNYYPDLLLDKDLHLISLLESRKANGKSDSAIRTELLKAAATGKSAEALFEVAKMYETGAYGMEEDEDQAFDFYLAAAENGHAGAMTQLGMMYATTSGPHRDGGERASQSSLAEDLDTAIDWFEKAGALGDPGALNALAYLYLHGKGVDRAVDKAAELYRTAAQAGHPEALLNWGELLLRDEAFEEALEALHQAEAQGQILASFRLGQLYEEGVDDFYFPQSCESAAAMYKRAGESGYWISGVRYGIDLYKAGLMEHAVTFLAMAAEEGYEIAQANAAYMLEHRMGYSLPDADDLALRFYDRAALQSPDHYFALGNLMLRMEKEGKSTSAVPGPVTGLRQAMGYLEEAVEMGQVQALRKLAEMYEVGEEGVLAQDTAKALGLYKRLVTLLSRSQRSERAQKIGNKLSWSSMMDIGKLQWKVTSLSAKSGLASVLHGGDKKDGEKAQEGILDVEGQVSSAAEGL